MDYLAKLLSVYIFALGIMLMLVSTVEFIFPVHIYSLWRKWVNHKFFPIHGVIVILGGLPLTLFREGISGKIMMAIGLFVVFMGPFILLFPKKVRELFILSEAGIEEEDRRGIIYFDAIIRGLAGAIFVYTIVQNGTFD